MANELKRLLNEAKTYTLKTIEDDDFYDVRWVIPTDKAKAFRKWNKLGRDFPRQGGPLTLGPGVGNYDDNYREYEYPLHGKSIKEMMKKFKYVTGLKIEEYNKGIKVKKYK
jgi:hypothetical protein